MLVDLYCNCMLQSFNILLIKMFNIHQTNYHTERIFLSKSAKIRIYKNIFPEKFAYVCLAVA